MKLRTLIVAMVVLLGLLGTLYWSGHRKNTEDASAKADSSPVILKLDESAITRLEFKKKDADPIVLAKKSVGWAITEPKSLGADQGTVSSTLSTLASLSSERLVEDHASDLKPFGLEPPVIEIDVTGKDNKQQKLLIGDETPTGNAYFAKLAADPRVYTIASYNKTSLDKTLNDLRDKRLLTIDSNKISRVELTAKNQTLEFGRNKDDWQILKPRPLRADNFQVAELVRKLTDAKMPLGTSATEIKDDASAFAHGTPVASVKVTDPLGSQALEVRKNKDSYYAKSSIVDGAYEVDADLGAALNKSLDDFREKKVFDLGFSDPNKIEMHNGAKSYFFTRNGADWWGPEGKKMDAATVQDFVSKLRDLTATKLLDSGFANPTIDIVVTTDDGKRVEKVALAKSTDGYLAKRENDSTIYSLKSDAVESVQKAADAIKPATKPAK